jgi:agmatinase
MPVDNADAGFRLPEETWADTIVKPRSFYGAPVCSNLDELEADVAFLGVPFDLGSPIRGARDGPDAIRETRVYAYRGPMGTDRQSRPPGYYDLDADRQRLEGVTMVDCGDVVILPSDVDRNFWRITRAVRAILARGPLLVAVGGDHAITPAVVRGFERFGQVDLVQFDAHHDYLDHVQGVRWTHGSPIRRVSEFPWVGHITQVGLRVNTTRDPIDASRARGNTIITTDQFLAVGPDAAMAQVPESDAMYVTFDIDVMDPSTCPGTGAPEPGGLTYHDMRAAFRTLARRGRIIGVDIVEVAPALDPTGITSKTASRLIIDLLSAITDGR